MGLYNTASAGQFGGPIAEPPINPLLRIEVGDLVRAKLPNYEVRGTVLAVNEHSACVSEAPGSWDTYFRVNIVQVIKRANAPQPEQHWRVRAEVFYLVKAYSAEEALDLVEENPDQRIDFVLVALEDVKPLAL